MVLGKRAALEGGGQAEEPQRKASRVDAWGLVGVGFDWLLAVAGPGTGAGCVAGRGQGSIPQRVPSAGCEGTAPSTGMGANWYEVVRGGLPYRMCLLLATVHALDRVP